MTDPHNPPGLPPTVDDMTVELRLDRKDGPPAGYILHRYVDTVTGEVEVIWNSRPGCIPMQVISPAGNPASLERPEDVGIYKGRPGHTPKVGDRVIVDITPQRARQLAEERIAAVERGDCGFGRAKLEWMYATFRSREEAVADAANYFMTGGCMLLTVTSGWLEGLERERAERVAVVATPERVGRLTREVLASLDPRLLIHIRNAMSRMVPMGTLPTGDLRFTFRGPDGRKITMEQWERAHTSTPHTIVCSTKIYGDEAVELHVIATWTGVDPGDGKIFEHEIVVTFESGVLQTGDNDDRTVRLLGMSETGEAAERLHEDLVSAMRAKLDSGHLEEIVTSTVLEHMASGDDAISGEVVDPQAFRRFIAKVRSAGVRKHGGGKAS